MAHGRIRDSKGLSFSHPKYCTFRWRTDVNIRHQISTIGHGLVRASQMTYHKPALLPNSCCPIAFGPFGVTNDLFYLHPKYWSHRWRIDINTRHLISPIGPGWGESSHMTYHSTALLPNNYRLMVHGLYLDPKGLSYLHHQYWTLRWRIDGAIGPSYENQATWHIIIWH